MKVLIVDDERQLVDALAFILKKTRLHAIAHTTGKKPTNTAVQVFTTSFCLTGCYLSWTE